MTERGGVTNILLGLNLIGFVPVLYCKTWLGADQESYGTNLMVSGTFQGLALSILIWIYCFTENHTEDEKALVSVFGKSILSATLNTTHDSSGEEAGMWINDHSSADDNEF